MWNFYNSQGNKTSFLGTLTFFSLSLFSSFMDRNMLNRFCFAILLFFNFVIWSNFINDVYQRKVEWDIQRQRKKETLIEPTESKQKWNYFSPKKTDNFIFCRKMNPRCEMQWRKERKKVWQNFLVMLKNEAIYISMLLQILIKLYYLRNQGSIHFPNSFHLSLKYICFQLCC
jgi:hypothetical protein